MEILFYNNVANLHLLLGKITDTGKIKLCELVVKEKFLQDKRDVYKVLIYFSKLPMHHK